MSEDLERIEKKLDEVLAALPMIHALGSVLVRLNTVNERVGLNKNTISQNDKIPKYEIEKQRKTFIEVKDIAVIKKRKRK